QIVKACLAARAYAADQERRGESALAPGQGSFIHPRRFAGAAWPDLCLKPLAAFNGDFNVIPLSQFISTLTGAAGVISHNRIAESRAFLIAELIKRDFGQMFS